MSATIESSLQQGIREEEDRFLTIDELTGLIQQSLTRQYPDDDDANGIVYISNMAAEAVPPPPNPNTNSYSMSSHLWTEAIYSRDDLKKAVAEAHRLAQACPGSCPRFHRDPNHEGHRDFADGRWVYWALYNRRLADSQVADLKYYMGSHSSGPGRAFTRPATIRRTNTRTLFVQTGGLDI